MKMKAQMKNRKKILVLVLVSKIQRMNENENHQNCILDYYLLYGKPSPRQIPVL